MMQEEKITGNRFIITPITEKEIIEYNMSHEDKISMQNVIALYKNEGSDFINVGFPSKSAYVPSLANMYGYKESTNKSLFLNGGYKLFKSANNINKPVYAILMNENHLVSEVESLNMYNNSIDSILENDKKVKVLAL